MSYDPNVVTAPVPDADLAPGAANTTKVTNSGATAVVDALITDANVASANKDGTTSTPSLRTLGTGSAQAAAGNDSRLSDARTPTAHASSHLPNASDALAWAASIHMAGVDGSKPAAAAGNAGTFYFSTDINGGTLYRSTGAAWVKVALGASEVSAGSVVAREVDLSPSDSVTTIEFPNGTLSIAGGVATYTPAGSGAATSEPFVTYGDTAGLSAELNLRNLLPANNHYWPPYVPKLTDLDADSLWWQKVGTPTGGVIYTTATAEGIATTYGDDLMKMVAAAANDGCKTRYTYANEIRVRAGAYQATLYAVYAAAGKTITCAKIDSTAATLASVVLAGNTAWQLVALEPGSNALGGTYVEDSFKASAATTFYVIPLGDLISPVASPKALPLHNRAIRWVDALTGDVVSNVDPGGTAWTTLDLTASTSPLAFLIQTENVYYSSTANDVLYIQRKRGSDAAASDAMIGDWAGVATTFFNGVLMVPTDDGQNVRYGSGAAAGHTEHVYISVSGFWEYA